jgi:hypothetical protein
MKTIVDVVLIIAWVTAYLTVVYGVGHYRQARARALGVAGPHDYRAEKDAGLWLAVFLAGTLLCALAYVATKAFGQAL